MQNREYTTGKIHLLRLGENEDLLGEIEEFCKENSISAALISAMGTVKEANLGFYNQEAKKYVSKYLDEPLEMIMSTGNVSLKDGEAFVHLHGFFSAADMNVVGGHVFEGTTVFAVEVSLQEIEGEVPQRKPDRDTGLNLWDLS